MKLSANAPAVPQGKRLQPVPVITLGLFKCIHSLDTDKLLFRSRRGR